MPIEVVIWLEIIHIQHNEAQLFPILFMSHLAEEFIEIPSVIQAGEFIQLAGVFKGALVPDHFLMLMHGLVNLDFGKHALDTHIVFHSGNILYDFIIIPVGLIQLICFPELLPAADFQALNPILQGQRIIIFQVIHDGQQPVRALFITRCQHFRAQAFRHVTDKKVILHSQQIRIYEPVGHFGKLIPIFAHGIIGTPADA